MKDLLLMIIFCLLFVLAGCSSKQAGKQCSQDVLNCGPVALAAYSKLTSKTDKDIAAKALQIYEIIGKKEGSAVSMLDLKQAAIDSGFDVNPQLLTAEKLKDLRAYAIVYIRQDNPGKMGHFVLARFSDGKMFEVNPSTLEEMPLNVDIREWTAFSLILHNRS